MDHGAREMRRSVEYFLLGILESACPCMSDQISGAPADDIVKLPST